jgi:predicted molibdopterin-dependent oxidoreductase YjgC
MNCFKTTMAHADRVIPQLIRDQFDDASWNQAFDAALSRFQALQQGIEAAQKLSGPNNS